MASDITQTGYPTGKSTERSSQPTAAEETTTTTAVAADSAQCQSGSNLQDDATLLADLFEGKKDETGGDSSSPSSNGGGDNGEDNPQQQQQKEQVDPGEEESLESADSGNGGASRKRGRPSHAAKKNHSTTVEVEETKRRKRSSQNDSAAVPDPAQLPFSKESLDNAFLSTKERYDSLSPHMLKMLDDAFLIAAEEIKVRKDDRSTVTVRELAPPQSVLEQQFTVYEIAKKTQSNDKAKKSSIQKSFPKHFGRGASHVAVAHYIFYNKNKLESTEQTSPIVVQPPAPQHHNTLNRSLLPQQHPNMQAGLPVGQYQSQMAIPPPAVAAAAPTQPLPPPSTSVHFAQNPMFSMNNLPHGMYPPGSMAGYMPSTATHLYPGPVVPPVYTSSIGNSNTPKEVTQQYKEKG